jgi:hypothetical protein
MGRSGFPFVVHRFFLCACFLGNPLMATAEVLQSPPLKIATIARRHNKHYNSILRWLKEGVLLSDGKRIKLPAIRAGGTWEVSEEALSNFLDALTRGYLSDDEAAVQGRTPKSAHALRIARMNDACEKAGI